MGVKKEGEQPASKSTGSNSMMISAAKVYKPIVEINRHTGQHKILSNAELYLKGIDDHQRTKMMNGETIRRKDVEYREVRPKNERLKAKPK